MYHLFADGQNTVLSTLCTPGPGANRERFEKLTGVRGVHLDSDLLRSVCLWRRAPQNVLKRMKT